MTRYFSAIFVTILLFSAIEAVIKLIGPTIDPLFLAFLRFFCAGAIILASTGFRVARVKPRDLAGIAILAIIGVAVGFGSFHIGLRHIEAAPAAVIFSINPLFSYITAALLLGEQFTARRLLGLISGVAGAYVVEFGFERPEPSEALGPALLLLSAAAFGTYVAAAKIYVRKYGPRLVTGLIFVLGSLLLLALVHDFTITTDLAGWLSIGFLIFFATGVAYLLYFYGLRHLPVGAGASMFFLKPVFAPIFAVTLLGDTLSPHFYAGVLLVMGSLALAIGNVWKGSTHGADSSAPRERGIQ